MHPELPDSGRDSNKVNSVFLARKDGISAATGLQPGNRKEKGEFKQNALKPAGWKHCLPPSKYIVHPIYFMSLSCFTIDILD
jgi:hypothetical protein